MSAKTCARCGKLLRPTVLRVYSSFSHHYYCANVNACAKRARRVKRTKVAA